MTIQGSFGVIVQGNTYVVLVQYQKIIPSDSSTLVESSIYSRRVSFEIMVSAFAMLELDGSK
jgi:hypothetical protein